MGFTKWLQKNGWGGVGAIARSVCDELANAYIDPNDEGDIRRTYSTLIYGRRLACVTLGKVIGRSDLYDDFEWDFLIDLTKYDLRNLIFFITVIEEKQFRKLLQSDKDLLMTSLEIINEIAANRRPILIKVKDIDVVETCSEFMNLACYK